MKFVCENCKAKYQIGDDKVAGKTLRMKCRRCGHMIQVSSSVTESSVSRANPTGAREPTGELTGAELLLTGVHAAVSAPSAESEPEVKEAVRPAPDDDSATVVRPSPLFLRNTGMGLPAAGPPRPSVSGSAVARQPSAPRIVPPARASVRPSAPTSSRPASVAPPASGGGSSNLAIGFTRAVSSPPPAPAPDSTQTEDWYVGVGGVPLGPVRLSVIKEKAEAGAVDGESLVWREGFDEWQPLKLFPVLLALVDEARKRSVTPVPAQRSTFGSNPAATAPLAASPAAGMTANAAASGYSNGSSNGAHATAAATTPGADASLGLFGGASAVPSATSPEPAPVLADPFRPSVAPVGVMSDPFAKPLNGTPAAIPMSDSGGLSPSVIPAPSVGVYAGTDSVLRPTKKGVHPMAWAFVAMCAAFGGVAAWALFFRKSETQVVYQTASATSSVGNGAGTRPGSPGSNPGGGDASNPSDPSNPSPDSSGGVQSNPNNPGYRMPGTSPSTSKSAKPDGSGAVEDYDPRGFDTGNSPPGPKATSDSTSNTGKGNLSAGEIEGVVNRNKPSISRRCWDPAYDASDGKTKSAKVTANVTIGPSGSVTSVTASGGGGFPTLASCVQGSIAGWRFPPADGESRTVIPFSFSKQ